MHLSGESVSDLENARYLDRASGRGSSNRYPRTQRIWSMQHPYVCMYVTSLLGERWEFLYERRAEKNKEQRRTILVAIF